MLYGMAFIGSWIEQFGTILQARGATNVGIFTSLLMPVEAIWRLVAYVMEPPLIKGAPISARVPSPFGSYSVPSTLMVYYAAAYAIVMLLLAMRAFNRRDL